MKTKNQNEWLEYLLAESYYQMKQMEEMEMKLQRMIRDKQSLLKQLNKIVKPKG